MISLLEYDYISILHYDIIICILLFDLSHLLPFTVVNVGYQSTLPATCPGVTMFPHFPMKYSEKYKNTKIQKYENTKIKYPVSTISQISLNIHKKEKWRKVSVTSSAQTANDLKMHSREKSNK